MVGRIPVTVNICSYGKEENLEESFDGKDTSECLLVSTVREKNIICKTDSFFQNKRLDKTWEKHLKSKVSIGTQQCMCIT